MKASDTYEHIPTKRSQILTEKYSKNLSLDAGCGEGAYLNSFHGEVVALDVHLPSLKKAKAINRTPKTFFVRGDIRFLPFHRGVFNFVLSASVIEHIPEKDVDQYFNEMYRITNGLIMLEVP